DGIRDFHVTGVQTCALPIYIERDSGVIGRLERSFSDDPETVAQHAREVVKAHLANGVIPVLKHFPGHGSARNDSHKGLTDVTDKIGRASWRERGTVANV